MSIHVNSKQLKDLLKIAIPARKTVGIIGEPGSGKTQIAMQVTKELGYDLIVTDVSTSDITVPGGFPWINTEKKRAEFYPFGDLKRILDTPMDKPVVWLLDDYGWGMEAVKLAYSHFLYEKRINDFDFSDKPVTVLVTSNEAGQRAGVTGWPEPAKSRCSTIVKLVPDVDSVRNYLATKGAPMSLLAHLKIKADRLCAFKPTANLTNSPCPRTWEEAGKWVNLGLKGDTLLAALSGCVGEGDAQELIATMELAEQAPDFDEILKNPMGASLPAREKLDMGYVVATGLAYRAEIKTWAAITKYAERLAKDNQGEIAVLLIRDCIERKKELGSTTEWAHLITKTVVGPLITGVDQ
jgi:hypothetical protein